jgi:tetratricopeptide (TPR) repeat protein
MVARMKVLVVAVLVVFLGAVALKAMPRTPDPQRTHDAAAATKTAISKNIDWAFERRMDAIRRKVDSLEMKGRADMDTGEYERAIELFNRADRITASTPFHKFTTQTDRVECEFELRRYRNVVKLCPERKWLNALSASATGISHIRLGETKKALSYYSKGMILDRSLTPYAKFLPGTKSAKQLECSFRLARGVALFYKAQWKRALPELKEAVALQPRQPLASYFLEQCCARTGDVIGVQRCYPAAEVLGGSLADLAKSTLHEAISWIR